MHDAALVFRAINLIAYPALGLVTLLYWRRRRDAASMWAAATFGTLGLLVLLGLIPDHAGNLAEARRRSHRHRAARALPLPALSLHDRLQTTRAERRERTLLSDRDPDRLDVRAAADPPARRASPPVVHALHRRLHDPLDGALDRVRTPALARRKRTADRLTTPDAPPRDRLRGPDRGHPAAASELRPVLGHIARLQHPRHAERLRVPARLRAAAASSACGGARRKRRACSR